uniref:Ribonuclease H protein At1g65750 family n=1 Tax=Cajanus cajan TaxID=3821 RepID=A0A151SAX4_CAJCA|nr:Putative ribonuclease H protein At1g65750 family [Cajanus cajan]
MQMVHMPRSICDEVDKLSINFLWGDRTTHRKIHTISWDKICRPKEHGELGLRSLREVNNLYDEELLEFTF